MSFHFRRITHATTVIKKTDLQTKEYVSNTDSKENVINVEGFILFPLQFVTIPVREHFLSVRFLCTPGFTQTRYRDRKAKYNE